MEFRQQARLLEVQTRYLAMYASQSKEAARAASEISFLPDEDEEVRREIPSGDGFVQRPSGLHVPASDNRAKPKVEEPGSDEPLDEESRRSITQEREEAGMNKTGSYERLQMMFRMSHAAGGTPTPG